MEVSKWAAPCLTLWTLMPISKSPIIRWESISSDPNWNSTLLKPSSARPLRFSVSFRWTPRRYFRRRNLYVSSILSLSLSFYIYFDLSPNFKSSMRPKTLTFSWNFNVKNGNYKLAIQPRILLPKESINSVFLWIITVNL